MRIGSDSELNLNIGYLAGYEGLALQNTIMEFAKKYPESLSPFSRARTKSSIVRSERAKPICFLAINAVPFQTNTKTLF